MNDLRYIALVSQTPEVPNWQAQIVAAALDKQVNRDLAPIWGLQATVNAFDLLEDVPTGYWPIVIRDDIGFPGAAGIHLDDDGQPFGLVQATNTWTLTASHECLEILVDPLGSRLRAGPSIKQDQGRVEYLVEVCDPSEDIQFAYRVNGVLVSDFYTSEFFLPRPGNVRYSFTGAIGQPRTILENGYISWLDPATGSWWQQIFFGQNKEFVELGPLTATNGSFRSQIDRKTFELRSKSRGATSLTGLPEDRPELQEQAKSYDEVNAAAKGKQAKLQDKIDRLRKGS